MASGPSNLAQMCTSFRPGVLVPSGHVGICVAAPDYYCDASAVAIAAVNGNQPWDSAPPDPPEFNLSLATSGGLPPDTATMQFFDRIWLEVSDFR